MEAKQGAVQPASKEHRSENDTMPVKHSPSQQFHHPPKLTSADLRNSMHISPNTPSKPSGTNSSERASCKDTNCSDNYGSSTASSENSPHVSSHMTWKAKMLRQHVRFDIFSCASSSFKPKYDFNFLNVERTKNSREQPRSTSAFEWEYLTVWKQKFQGGCYWESGRRSHDWKITSRGEQTWGRPGT